MELCTKAHAGPRISGWRAIIDRDRELCTKAARRLYTDCRKRSTRPNCVFNPCRESLRCSEMSVAKPRCSSNSRIKMRPASEVMRNPWNATFRKPLKVN